MHDQWDFNHVIIAISPGKSEHIPRRGYMEIWTETKPVFSASLQASSIKDVPMRPMIPKPMRDERSLYFYFRMNPEHIGRSWFNYQIRGDNDSAEMNCIIRLKHFLDEEPGRARPEWH